MLKKSKVEIRRTIEIIYDSEKILPKEIRKIIDEELPSTINLLVEKIYNRIEVDEEELELS